MDRPDSFGPKPVDRTPYGAFSLMAGALVGTYVLAAWLLGIGIGHVRRAKLSLPSVSLPHVATPADVGSQVQGALQNAADSAAKQAANSATQAATQAAKNEAATQAQAAQQSLESNLQNSLK